MSKLIDAVREELAELRTEAKEAVRRERDRNRRIAYLEGLEERERNQVRDNGVKAVKAERKSSALRRPRETAGFTEQKLMPDFLRLLAEAENGELPRIALTEATSTNGGNSYRATKLLAGDGLILDTGRKGGRAGKSPIYQITDKGRKEVARHLAKAVGTTIEKVTPTEQPRQRVQRPASRGAVRKYTVSDVGVANLARVEAFLKRQTGPVAQKEIQDHLGHSGAGTVSKCVAILVDHKKARKFTGDQEPRPLQMVEYLGGQGRETVVRPGEGVEEGRRLPDGAEAPVG